MLGSPAERNLDFGFAGLLYPVEKLGIWASQLVSALLYSAQQLIFDTSFV